MQVTVVGKKKPKIVIELSTQEAEQVMIKLRGANQTMAVFSLVNLLKEIIDNLHGVKRDV